MSNNMIAQSFNRGALRYDELASVQRRVASTLLEMAMPQVCAANSIVDLGCGTGRLLAACRSHNSMASLTGVDISVQMLAYAVQQNPKLVVLQKSLENTGLASCKYDLVLSSSAMQWANLAAALNESARLVSPNGKVAIACFLDGTLASWRRIWGGQHQKMPIYSDVLMAARGAGLTLVASDIESITEHHLSFNDALASVKGVGAGGNSSTGPGFIGRRKVQAVRREINELGARECGFPMEYNVAYLVAEKKSGGCSAS